MCGSPIVYSVIASTISGECAFHRVNLEVTVGLYDPTSADGSTQTLTLSSPAESGETLEFDISSALRAAADAYSYSPTPPSSYPYIWYTLKAYDEYMQNGEVHENVEPSSMSTKTKTLMGAYSDLERLLSTTGYKSAQHFTRKPYSTPEIVAVGETMVCPQSFSSAVSLGSVSTGPTSKEVAITTAGLQTVNGRKVFAVASTPDRYEFRFVNGLGCLESVSVHSYRTTEVNLTSESYIVSKPETFNDFSRGLVVKTNDYETWKLSSGPLDQQWQSWFIHEFIMTKHCWVKIGSNWVRCHILAEDTITGMDRSKAGMLEVTFSVQLDINGSPLAALAI